MCPTREDDLARKARADADKAEAEARAARVAADRAEQEQREWNGELARRQREADARKSIAEADRSEVEGRQAEIAGLVPDLGKVDRGETTLAGEQTMFASVLAHRALISAASTLVSDIEERLAEDHKEPVLITDDPDLVRSDAAYGEVNEGIERLIAAADKLLPKPPAGPAHRAIPALAAGAAVAAAVPSVVSLLAARRSISSYSTSVDTTAAVAQVAGELAKERAVRIDEFRRVPNAPILTREKYLQERRAELVREKQAREEDRIQHDALRASAQEEVDTLRKQLDALTRDKPDYKHISGELKRARQERDDAVHATKDAALVVGLIGDLLAAIDAFSASIHAVPGGEGRSPLMVAALRQELHGEPATVSRVLFVSACGGSATQLFSDRPLWSKDKYEIVASVSVSYWLLDTSSDCIVAAGVASGTARLTGSVGATFSIDSPAVSDHDQ